MSNKDNKYLIVIAGPTGIGKTEVAFQVNKELKSIIISADSRQIYKELTIGTAKPSKKEIIDNNLRLVDHVSIHDYYNVGIFEREASQIIEEAFVQNQACILCGGTGLYIKAVCEGLNHFPDVEPIIKSDLIDTFKKEGLENLRSELKSFDPEYYEIVDLNNSSRVIRALSVIRQSGQKFSSFINVDTTSKSFQVINIVLEMNRNELYDRIDKRVLTMISDGLLEEVKGLGNEMNIQALQTVGYKELFRYLAGDCDLQTAISEIQKNSRRYAKRQLTWLRKYNLAKRFHPSDIEGIKAHISEEINLD